MEQRPLGNTGLQVSALGFGCGAVGGLMVRGDAAEQRQAVSRAIDAGITYFDTAASYGDGLSEEHLGHVMRELGAWSRVVVGTKVRLGPAELGKPIEAIRASIEASLKRLGRDHVDLLNLHNPIALVSSDSRSMELGLALSDVARGLQQVVQAGLAHHVGFTGLGETTAIQEMVRAEPFESVQAYFNILNPSAVIVIRVLAAGAASAVSERAANAGDPGGNLVSGGSYASDLERAHRAAGLARELGLTGPVELAIRFGLSKPGVSTVLVGYSTLAQLDEAITYAERGPLSPEAIQRVLDLSGPLISNG